MRTLVLLMAALFLAAGLASAPAQAIGVQKEMKVGFIYISPIGEEGWSYAHDQARKFLSTLPGVTTSYVESVPEGQDAERIIQSYVEPFRSIKATCEDGKIRLETL